MQPQLSSDSGEANKKSTTTVNNAVQKASSKIVIGSENPENITIVNSYVANIEDKAAQDLISRGSDVQPDPFESRLIDKKIVVFLPKNIIEIDRLLFRQLVALIKAVNVEIRTTDKDFEVNAETIPEREFFYGFFRVLTRQPTDQDSFAFSTDTPQARGAGQAKLMILQKALGGDYNNIRAFLPKSLFSEEGTSKLDLEVNALAKTKGTKIAALRETLKKAVGAYLKDNSSSWINLAKEYTIPKSAALEGLHKTKKTKVKGVVKTEVKKPKRPSKRVEVYLEAERLILKQEEKSFDQYSSYVKSLPEGIAAVDLPAIRLEVARLIRECWLTVEKSSAIITKRRAILLANGSDKKNDKDLTKAKVEKAIAEISKKDMYEALEDLLPMNPKKLLLKFCTPEDSLILTQMELSLKGYYLPGLDKLSPGSSAVMKEFIKVFNLYEGRSNYKQPKKSTASGSKFPATEDWGEDVPGADGAEDES